MSTQNTPSTNNGIVNESDVYGQQFVENELNVIGDEIDARHAFLLTEDAAGDRGRLIQVFSGIENAVEEFYGYNLSAWSDKSMDGHEIPDGAQSHYVAFRQTDPVDIIKEDNASDPFPADMYTNKEYFTGDEFTIDVSTELIPLEAYIWEQAETETEIFEAIDAYQHIANGTEDTDTVRAIEPQDNPDTEAEMQQCTSTFFWSHIVGTPVLKLELDETGMYQPIDQVRYEWVDADNRDKGVHRVE